MAALKESQHEKLSRLSNPKSKHTDYYPTTFLRCHSSKTADVDRRTNVWKCAFEPIRSANNPNTVFATCGGNSVCVIDAESGLVKTKHYSKDDDEDFTALAWNTVTSNCTPENILAVAGKKFVLHLLHPDEPVCFLEHSLLKKNGNSEKVKRGNCVESLMFHPKESNILFGVFTSGEVHIWDIGKPHSSSNYESKVELLQMLNTYCASSTLAFSTYGSMLLVATQEGVAGWLCPRSSIYMKQNLKQLRFVFPTSQENLGPGDEYYVDSIEVIRDGKMIATKCALHGCIYIWDLDVTLNSGKKSSKPVKSIKTAPITVNPLHILKWSDTDNFYMNIGIDTRGNILACGDDKGNLWMYNIKEILELPSREHDCVNIIEWPHVRDARVIKKKMLSNYGDSDVVVNKVSFNYDSSFLVAVTSTNIVCIWKCIQYCDENFVVLSNF